MKRRLLSIFCALALCLGLLPATAWAADEVSYLAYSWDGSKLTSEMKSVTDYTLVASTDTAWGAAGETTWYVADGDVSISNRVDVNGSVNLLLKDDCELSPNFIIISAGSTLTIYAQTEGETAGKLVCNGIGTVGSTLIIHGGTVNATGTIGAGIGGRSRCEQGGTVTIYGGTVNASGSNGAGIGGGSSSSVDTNVNVIDSSCGNGGTVTIYGGTVNASGTNGAGIGGGSAAIGYYAGQQYYVGGGGGTITINGGTVNATGTSGGIGAGPNCGSKDFTNKVTPKGTLKGTSIGLITGTLVPSLNTSSFTGLIKNGGTYTVYGNLSLDTLETPLSISEGENLSINGSLNIPVGKTVTVTNAGTIDCGSGKFVNNGTLYLDNSGTVNGTFGGSGVFLISVDLPDDTNDLTAFPDTFTYTGEDFAGQIFLGTGGTQELGGKTFWETVRTDGWTITYAKDGQSTETVIDAGEYTATFTPPEGETITRTFTVKRAAQTISAPEIQSQSEGAVTLKPVTGVVGKVEYGYSTTNDAASIDNWQESPTFNDMTYGTYYFFAKVTGDSNHEDAVSSTGTVVAFREISSISITSNPTKMLYTPGATLDLTGLKITVTYTDNSTAEVTWTADSGITTSIPNGTSLTASHDGQTITITYGGKTAVTDSLLIYDEVPQQIDGVYQIGTVKELIWFAALVNGTLTDGTEQNTAANAVLTADIDLGGRLWAPIASSTIFRSGSFSVNGTTNTSYSGIFDGQGHIISNFKIRTNSDELTSGLFGAVTGTIENLGIVNASFDNGGAYDGRFGALCGLLVKDRFTKTAATIQNCYVVGSSIAATRRIAGTVCGANYGGTIEDCYECGNTVTAHERIGHLVGDNHNDYDYNPMTGIVTNCYSDTKLAGTQGGTVNGGGVKDAEEFASGEVAYLLNGSTSENVIWYQNVDIGTKDNYPVLDSSHGIVYFIEEEPVRYSNDPDATAEPTDISSATVTLSQNSFTYNGTEQKPTVIVVLGDKTLTADTHYTVTYSGDGINAGTYTVTVTGTGSYTGEANQTPTYTINKATPTLTWSEGSQTLPYTGSPADITAPTVNLVNNETYSGTISYKYKTEDAGTYAEGLPIDAGTYTVMASIVAQGNYTAASGELTLTIKKAAASGTASAVAGLTYNGQAQNLVTAGNVTGGTMQYSTDGSNYSTAIPTGTNVGEYSVWYYVKGDANHTDSTPASLNVTIAQLPVELTWSNTDFTYDGSAKCPTAAVSNKVNTADEVNVTVSGGQTNASDTAYTATATGLSGSDAANYTLTGGQNITQTFTIAKANPDVNVPTGLTATYGDTLGDVTLPEGWAWDAPNTSVGNVGDNTFVAIFTPSDTVNYNTVTENLTVTVSAKDITNAVITLGDALTYTGQEQTQQIASVTVDNMTVTYTVSGNTGTDAGDYTLTISGTGNFTGEATQKWSIAKATYTGTTGVSGTVLANWPDKVTLPAIPDGASYGAASYDGSDGAVKDLSIEGGVLSYTGGESITVNQAYKITVQVDGGKNYEDYTITVTLTGSDKQTLTITGVTAQGGTYNGQAQAGYTGTPSAEGYTGDFTVTYSPGDTTSPTNAGTYTVTIAIPDSDPRYVGRIVLEFTIAKKALTVSAPSPSVYVGDSAPELALTYTGLVDGDSVTPSQEPDFTITKSDNTVIDLEDAVKTAGTYTITWSNAGNTTFPDGANYAIQKKTTGTLTVSNRSSGGTTTYPVQVEENIQNGGVQVSPKNAVPGTLVTVTPQPAPGYELATLSVLDQYGNEVDVNPLGNGNYSFKMPRSGVKVEATFYCTGSELCPTHHLADVLVKAWYHDAVDYVVEHGIMTGTSATTFEPNTTLSRAMVAQILYNLEGQPAVEGESTFTDASTHWAVDAITWAQKTGVVDGYENNTFRPNQAVTREELAQMLYNYAQYKKITLPALGDLSKFPDGDKVSPWARTAMKWATGLGVINGYEDSTLEPGGDSTRAQAASILMRFDQNLVEN